MSPATERLTAALAGRYAIERELGSGGMATVYLARDLKHDREVALKVLRPELAAVLGADRFLNEVRITARLEHPHIVTLIDSGESDGFLWYVLPYIRGESLRDLLNREKQLGIDQALAIARQIAGALDYAHQHGVIHRDIKPENVLLHEGEAMLADFGIALAVKEAGGNRLTETGLSLGTPQYMSPEQATGDRQLDARSDVYSLGAVLYEMLAGEPPHTGPTVQAVIAKLLTERPTRLRTVRDTVPDGIDAAVAKALAKIPADRFHRAGDFAAELVRAASPVHGSRPRRWLPFAVAGGTAIAALIVIVARHPRAAPPSIDRAQLTVTGNSFKPSLSPDGARLAYAEKLCDPQGYCQYQIVIQDADGAGRLVLAGGAAVVWSTQWTRDGRFLLYAASYGSSRWGVFVVPTLGGPARFLGCCNVELISGDTVAISPEPAPADTIGWVRFVTARDGQVRDSFAFDQPGGDAKALPTDDPGVLLLATVPADDASLRLRLVDRAGRVQASATPALEVRGRRLRARWLPGGGAVLIALEHEPESGEYDLLRLPVGRGRIATRADTLLHRQTMSDGWFEPSPGGAQLTYATGPVDETIWSLVRVGAAFTSHRISNSTTRIWARVAPDGDRVAFARQTVSGGRRLFQLFVIPFDGGPESPVSAPLNDLLDCEWSSDDRRLVCLEGVSSTQSRVVDLNLSDGRMQEMAVLDRDIANEVTALPGGGVVTVGKSATTVAVTGRPHLPDARWPGPPWLAQVRSHAPSPDGRTLAVMDWDRSYDSLVVGRMDLQDGTFTRLAAFGGEDWSRIRWLPDGNLEFVIQETRGGPVLYRMPAAGGRPLRLGNLPHAPASYDFSRDGRRGIAVNRSDRADVFTIRNFGEVWRP